MKINFLLRAAQHRPAPGRTEYNKVDTRAVCEAVCALGQHKGPPKAGSGKAMQSTIHSLPPSAAALSHTHSLSLLIKRTTRHIHSCCSFRDVWIRGSDSV